MNSPLDGLSYFVDGFSLLVKPGVKRFVVIPLCINIILFIALFFLMRHFMHEFNDWFTHHLPYWLIWLHTVIWLLFFISFFILFIYTFVILGNLVAAPFNSFLAEKVEAHLTGLIIPDKSFIDLCKDVPRVLARQFSIIGYYLPRSFLILLLFFIPLINSLAPFIWFLFNAWYITLTYLDYPTDNHQIPLTQVRNQMQEKRFLCYGFGISVLVASMIPIVNFFTIPAAAAGATKLWIFELRRNT